MIDLYEISWEQYVKLLYELKRHILETDWYAAITRIYGVPRGGLPIAVFLSHHLGLQLISEAPSSLYFALAHEKNRSLLIVDDIVDTGKTIEHYQKHCPGHWFASLVVKTSLAGRIPDVYTLATPGGQWVKFPYETIISTKETALPVKEEK